jgi:hypothetical protein
VNKKIADKSGPVIQQSLRRKSDPLMNRDQLTDLASDTIIASRLMT